MSITPSMDGLDNISIVIPTMKKAALPEVIAAYGKMVGALVQRIVVVDFDHDYTSRQRTVWPSGVHHIKVCGEPTFNKSLALNLGFQFVAGWVLFSDADIIIDRSVIAKWSRELGALGGRAVYSPVSVTESANGDVRPAPGIVATSPAVFEEVGGYRSDFEGWGLEDRDFLLRVELSGIPIFNLGSGVHLSHSEEERTQNYSEKNRMRTRENNLALMEGSRSGPQQGTLLNDTKAFRTLEEAPGIYQVCRIQH